MKVKAGVVQIGSVPFDAEKSTDKVVEWIEKAGEAKCDIVVFPEALLSAYPKGLDFGISVGVRRPEGREDFRKYYDSAINVPGPETDRIGEAAAKANTHVVIGVIERDGGTVYCTALFFGPDGSLMGKHRKLMPTAAERLIWGFGDGSTLPVFDTPIGKIGAVICWENYMPLLRMTMYGKGVNIYCAPTADDRESWLPSMRHIALEGRTFVLSSCQALQRKAYPEDYNSVLDQAPEEWVMHGGSAIINPLGQVLAGPAWDEETLLTAELDLDDVARAKLDFDAAGHYSRPDVFTLTVNEKPQSILKLVKED